MRNTQKMPAAQLAIADKIRLMSKAETCDRVGRTFPHIWKLMREGKFPRAREFDGKPVWLEHEIIEWIAALPVRRYKGDRTA